MECSIEVNFQEFPNLPMTPSKPLTAMEPSISHVSTYSAPKSENAVCTLASLIKSRSDVVQKIVESVSF